MKFCGCLIIGKKSTEKDSKKYAKRYTLKREHQKNRSVIDSSASNTGGLTMNIQLPTESDAKTRSSSESIDKVVLRGTCHDVSKRRSVTFANDSETEQRKFLRLNRTKRGSIHELQLNENKRVKSSPDVDRSVKTINTSYETTTCDELENSQQKKTTVRRRKRSKSPRKRLPSELVDAIKFDLVEPIGLDNNQLKTIPYENIKTSTQSVRVSISSYSSRHRRRRSFPFNRSGGVVHTASSHVLNYQTPSSVVRTAQIKSTKTAQATDHSGDFSRIRSLDVRQDERIRFECTLTSKTDAEEAMWMRIRAPHNPDILTYRDTVVYAPDHFTLEQRRVSSSVNLNGTFVDTYFLTLTITRPTIDDEGRYICSKGRTVFAEYDLFIIIPPQFVDHNRYIQKQTVIEGSTLHLSCSAYARPMPAITWFYRTNNGKHVLLDGGKTCQDSICELHLKNYTRHDPRMIECIADNGKSTQISRVFNIDVLFPPKVTTHIQTFTGLKSIDVFLKCSSMANPMPSISWFDDNRQEITNHPFYTIDTDNQSSILSFSVLSNEDSKVLYYCRSNNSVGTVEKLINIADFIQFDSKSTVSVSSSMKHQTDKPNRIRLKSPSTPTTISSSSRAISCYSFDLFLIFLIGNLL